MAWLLVLQPHLIIYSYQMTGLLVSLCITKVYFKKLRKFEVFLNFDFQSWKNLDYKICWPFKHVSIISFLKLLFEVFLNKKTNKISCLRLPRWLAFYWCSSFFFKVGGHSNYTLQFFGLFYTTHPHPLSHVTFGDNVTMVCNMVNPWVNTVQLTILIIFW